MLFARLTAAFGLLFALVTAAIIASQEGGAFFPAGLIIAGLCASP
jgi:hypothetical protein